MCAQDIAAPAPLTCTYCGGTKFYEGPSGGANTNIVCADPDCRHWFNDDPVHGLVDLHKVEPARS